MRDLLTKGEPCYAYFDRNLESVRTALQDLLDYIVNNGPYDGVLGFSEGAAFAASLIAQQTRRQDHSSSPIFKFAIFLCSAPAVDVEKTLRVFDASVDGEIIHMPTAHIIGAQDEIVHISIEVSKICDRRTREVFLFPGGHEVPRNPGTVSEIASCINRVLYTATNAQ